MNDPAGKRAVLLLSGGIDSATALALARDGGYEVFALTADYGQRNIEELRSARLTAARFEVAEHLVVRLEPRLFSNSALVGSDAPVPRRGNRSAMWSGVPPTYVPARNTVLLSLAVAWAETLGGADVVIGLTGGDGDRAPDCTQEYIDAYSAVADVGTGLGVGDTKAIRVTTPLMNMTKSEVIKLGANLGVDFTLTHTCYSPVNGLACSRCDACLIRRHGFAALGLTDPAISTPAPEDHATDGRQ